MQLNISILLSESRTSDKRTTQFGNYIQVWSLEIPKESHMLYTSFCHLFQETSNFMFSCKVRYIRAQNLKILAICSFKWQQQKKYPVNPLIPHFVVNLSAHKQSTDCQQIKFNQMLIRTSELNRHIYVCETLGNKTGTTLKHTPLELVHLNSFQSPLNNKRNC